MMTYTPDLYFPSLDSWVEIKGPLYDLQLKKMQAFVKTYKKNFIVITAPCNFERLKGFKVLNYHTITQENIIELIQNKSSLLY
jgi:hypothetical protein